MDDSCRKTEWAAALAAFDARCNRNHSCPLTLKPCAQVFYPPDRFGAAPRDEGADGSQDAASTTQPATDGDAASVTQAPDSGWESEPVTVSDLEKDYECIATAPGRLPTTQLRLVKAVNKDGKSIAMEEGQTFKLFLVSCLNSDAQLTIRSSL